MLVASAALAAVLLGAYFLTPVARLHYHAWRYRGDRHANDKHLKPALDALVARRASKQTLLRLLGEPDLILGEGEDCRLTYRVGLHLGYTIAVEHGRTTSLTEVVFYPDGRPPPPATKGS
jgi:hypothetical protein